MCFSVSSHTKQLHRKVNHVTMKRILNPVIHMYEEETSLTKLNTIVIYNNYEHRVLINFVSLGPI